MLADCFPFLHPYLEDEDITDLNYSGRGLWIDHLKKGRYWLDIKVEEEAIYQMAQKFANRVNRHFNLQHPLLETDLSCYRISMMHPSLTGELSLSIRKSADFCRIHRDNILKEGNISKTALDFLEKAVRLRKNILISGVPGSGKTEFLKFLTQAIGEEERVITIEDSFELHYASLHPKRDVVAMKIHAHFNYADAIKASLRQRADRILLSEVRGLEVVDLLTAASSGVAVMSTVHASSAFAIPHRIQTLIPSSREDLRQSVHHLLDLGIHMGIRKGKKGVERFVQEIVYYAQDEAYLVYDWAKKRDARKLSSEVREEMRPYKP